MEPLQPQKTGKYTPPQTTNGRKKLVLPPEALKDADSRYCVTIFKKRPMELYSYWRKFSNFPNFMKDVQSVEIMSETRSKWRVKLENGAEAQWTADIVKDVPGEVISWRSVEGSEVETSGTIWFAESTNGFGSVVVLTMDYHVPGGKLTEWLAAFKGEDPDTLAKMNLKRFKALMETGEVPTIDGQADGREGEIK